MADQFANPSYQANDISYEDMGQVSQTNPQAARQMETKSYAKMPKESAGFFDNYRQQERNTAAVSQARDQVNNMREVMSFKAQNFDDSEALKNKLNNMQQGAANTMVDAELQFKTDAAGRNYLSERQMQDWLSTKALKDEDWQNYQNTANIESDRRIQLLDAAYKKIEATETNAYQTFKQGLDHNTAATIANAKANLKEKLSEEQRKMQQRGVMVSALSTAGAGVGGIAGGIYGGPAGAAGGAAAGSLTGSFIGTQLSK